MSLTELVVRFTQFGAEWVMWVLMLLSILSVTVIIERLLYLRRHRGNADTLASSLEVRLRAGDLLGALRLVQDSQAIHCLVVAAGLKHFHTNAEAVSEAMLSVKARERLKLESHLSVLATLGNNAPFIGLLGTVLGIIKASQDVAAAQAAKQLAAGAVMAGVFEALVATAVGLFVAIPAVIAFNGFQRYVRTILGRVDVLAHVVLAHHRPLALPEFKPEPRPGDLPEQGRIMGGTQRLAGAK
jgi:biopolymer transport protein ExbB